MACTNIGIMSHSSFHFDCHSLKGWLAGRFAREREGIIKLYAGTNREDHEVTHTGPHDKTVIPRFV